MVAIRLFLVTAFLCGVFFAGAVSADVASKKEEPKPFKMAELEDQSMCRYIYPSDQDGHGGKPPIFRNVEDIYIRLQGYNYFPKERTKASNLLEEGNFSSLVGCTLEKFFYAGASSNGSAIPLYFLGDNPTQWPGNEGLSSSLVILVSYHLISGEGFYEKLFNDKIVQLTFNYYRYGSNSLDDARYSHCAQAFQFTENEEVMLRLLTKAVHGCLDQEYH